MSRPDPSLFKVYSLANSSIHRYLSCQILFHRFIDRKCFLLTGTRTNEESNLGRFRPIVDQQVPDVLHKPHFPTRFYKKSNWETSVLIKGSSSLTGSLMTKLYTSNLGQRGHSTKDFFNFKAINI